MTLLMPNPRSSTTSNAQSPPSRIPRSPALYRLPPRPRTTIFSSPKARPKIPGVTSASKPKASEPRLRSLVLVEKYHPPPSESESKPPFRVTAVREGKGKENGRRIPRTTRLSAPLPQPKAKDSPLKPKASPLKPSVAKSVSISAKPATIRIKAKVHRPRQSITTGMKGLSMSMRRNKGKRPALVIPSSEDDKVEQEPVEEAIIVAEPTADRSPSPTRSLSVSAESPALSPSLSSPSSFVFPRSPTASQPTSPMTSDFIAPDFSVCGSPSIVSSPPASSSLIDATSTPHLPRRKIIIPPFLLDTQSGPKDAKIRGELERLRAKKKVQTAAADVSLNQ